MTQTIAKLTPKQTVLAAFPNAYSHQQPSGGYVIFNDKAASLDDTKAIGQSTNANKAWADAEAQLCYHVPKATAAPVVEAAPPIEQAEPVKRLGAVTFYNDAPIIGTIPRAVKDKRRAKNKAARKARRHNR